MTLGAVSAANASPIVGVPLMKPTPTSATSPWAETACAIPLDAVVGRPLASFAMGRDQQCDPIGFVIRAQ